MGNPDPRRDETPQRPPEGSEAAAGSPPPDSDEGTFLSGPQRRGSELARLCRIALEFVRGFRALHFIGPCVTVFGSARFQPDHPYYEAAREVGEETGLPVDSLFDAHVSQRFAILPAWRSRYAPDVDSNLEHVWYLELDAPVPVRLDPSEHRTAVWLPVRQAAARVSSWTNRQALEQLVRSGVQR